MFLFVWLKKQIYHTSSESSWNSILPLGVWLVSNGSSITSPAEFSSTCCCSTEYLCTKNLPAHSKSNQIIKKIVACRQAEYTCAQIHWPATTDIFLDKHNSCNDAQQHDNNDRYHNGHCFRVGFFYLWKQKNKTNLQQVKKLENRLQIISSDNIFISCMRYWPGILDLIGHSHISAWGWSLYDLGSVLLHIYLQVFSCNCEPKTRSKMDLRWFQVLLNNN